MSINRSIVVERFVRKERARSQMRVFELSSLAGIYANNRCNGDIDAAYRELIKSFDDVGFLGARVLYLHPDVSPPYFRQGPDTNPDPKKPPPPYLPHKLAPIITRRFIKKRESKIGWSETRDGYLAHTWIPARQAARWLQSKGITPPSAIAWSLKARDAACAEPTPARRKTWKPKLGNSITPAEAAICDALNALWPNGDADHKAGVRNNSIIDWLKKQGKSAVSPRTIQRALSKIAYD